MHDIVFSLHLHEEIVSLIKSTWKGIFELLVWYGINGTWNQRITTVLSITWND